MDFWLVLSKNDSNNICSSIKNESFLKIWRVWHILKVCHALWYLKIEMGIAGSIFELHPPNFVKIHIFWIPTNDSKHIFCWLCWFRIWKKDDPVLRPGVKESMVGHVYTLFGVEEVAYLHQVVKGVSLLRGVLLLGGVCLFIFDSLSRGYFY